jgi:hypothetical protein
LKLLYLFKLRTKHDLEDHAEAARQYHKRQLSNTSRQVALVER